MSQDVRSQCPRPWIYMWGTPPPLGEGGPCSALAEGACGSLPSSPQGQLVPLKGPALVSAATLLTLSCLPQSRGQFSKQQSEQTPPAPLQLRLFGASSPFYQIIPERKISQCQSLGPSVVESSVAL